MKNYIAAFLLFVSLPGHSAEIPGWGAYVAGNFTQARTQARQAATADSLYLACRAGLMMGGFQEQGAQSIASLHTAIRDCASALEKDPDHLLALVSLAAGLGYEGKRLNSPDFPKISKKILEQLVAKHPDNAVALGALATWHSEVSAAGFFARTVLGASRKTAGTLFEKARQNRLNNQGIGLEFLKFLARGDKTEQEAALEVASMMLAAPAETAADKLLLEKAALLHAALLQGGRKNIKQTLEAVAAFPQIKDSKGIPAIEIKTVIPATLLAD